MRKRLGPNLVEFSDVISDQVQDIRQLINNGEIDLESLNTLSKESLVSAINEVLVRANSAVSMEAVDVVVQDYFVLHPQSFNYEQTSPSSSWLITHPLDHYPTLQVMDSAGTVWRGQVSYPARNKVLIQFNFALAGTAVLT